MTSVDRSPAGFASDEPPISVVVPTHGRTDLFLSTLASLEAQTLGTFELIVTDDSRDQEDRLLIQDATLGYFHRTGRRARYLFSEPSLGQARNTNQGLRATRGRLVRILHSDDILAPRALEAEVALMEDSRLSLDLLCHLVEPFEVAPRFEAQPTLSLVQPSLLFRSVLHSSTPLPSATVFRRETLEAIGGMREDMDFLCDWELAARLVVEQHRRHRFIGMLSPGFVGWRVHGDSTTGRLWDRHFLEHEQLMGEIAAEADLAEALIGDRGGQHGFFATAVRYRYRRLVSDVSRMTITQAIRALPRILRCALSPASVVARLTPAPWTRLGRIRYPRLAIEVDETPTARPHVRPSRAQRDADPRSGLRGLVSARVAGAIIRWGEAYARQLLPPPAVGPAAAEGPGLVDVGSCVEIRPTMDRQTAGQRPVLVHTEYNNSMNLWPLRQLMAGATEVTIVEINRNAFVEPVLHQSAKFLSVEARLDVTIADNEHLTSFGFKSLIDKQFPGQFAWADQAREGATWHTLRYRRRTTGHPCFTAPHTGWTFGMLTTGKRLEHVERFVDSIERHCREPFEVILVSPVDLGDLALRPGVRVLLFDERDELGWITKKKNLIAEQAAFSDVLICHDRFWLDEHFTQAFEDWGYAYGLAAVRVRLPDGTRAVDWAVVSSQNHVWSVGGLLDYRAYSQYAYNPGGATVMRKAFWQDFKWNENLFWNEHEDVELCRRVQRAGGLISLAAATLITAEDRWVLDNPRIPYCEQNEVLFGRPVGEQRIRFLPRRKAA